MRNESAMKKKRKKSIAAFLLCLCLLIAGGIPMILAEPGYAAETPQDGQVIMSNDQGQEVVIRVEEELTAEEMALQGKSAGLLDMGDSDVPLAGFDEIAAGIREQSVHLQWMVLLLLAVIAFAVYFSRYQTKIFDLRRQVADAEYEVQMTGRRGGRSDG